MAQANFAYAAPANHAAGLPLALSIFADRAHVRDQIRDDAEVAGFRIGEIGDVALLLSDDGAGGGESSLVPRALGEVVLLDCPQVTGASLAALARLDLRVAHCGAQLVVSTSIEALDDVFGCLDQSNPQILVNPSRAERVMALGRVLARMHNFKVRELSEEDRLTLLRLTEQVSEIALRLERFGDGGPSLVERDGAGGAFRFESPTRSFSAPEADSGERLARATRPALPDPRLVRRIIRQRQLRARFFDGDLFADPAWDMLLDLTAARVEHTRVSVTSLCIASSVPPTTALRWIGQMTDAGLLMRVEDETDRRRAFITMTDKAADAMSRFFAELGNASSRLV